MKRCPKCNRTYTTDTQKFCTHDGGILEGMSMGQETVRMDPPAANQDAPTQAISSELRAEIARDFDPFKTVMSRPEGTVSQKPLDTRDISSPASTMPPKAQPPAEPPPTPEQVPQSPTPSSVPPPSPPPPLPSAPTIALTGSGPIAAPVTPPPPVVSAPQSPAAVAPKKKSKLPLVLGILAILLLFGGAALGAAYWFVVRPMLARRVVVVDDTPPAQPPVAPRVENTPADIGSTNKIETPEPPPYTAPADAVEFVNSKESLDGKLAEHYVNFSFYYPNRWEKDPRAGVPGATNFAKVERRIPPDFTQENFAVGWNSSAAPVSENLELFHTLAEKLFAQFKSEFPGYRKVSEGPVKMGVYDGYEFRFEGVSKDTAKGDLKLWGRVILLPPQDGGKDGVTLLMLATSLAPELKSLDDVGVKGELPMMLQSFRFGKQ
jgi:hypothetical protein